MDDYKKNLYLNEFDFKKCFQSRFDNIEVDEIEHHTSDFIKAIERRTLGQNPIPTKEAMTLITNPAKLKRQCKPSAS